MIIQSPPAAATMPALDRSTAARLALAEYAVLQDLLHSLESDEWRAPTDCAGWDVRAIVAHLVGSAEDGARMRVYFRRKRQRGRRFPGMDGLAAHNECQIADRATVANGDLLALLASFAPAAVKARSRMPGLVRRITVSTGEPHFPRLTLGYLADLVFTRDVWMHRLDICRATGRSFDVDEHDGAIAAQAVRDVALAWSAPPAVLELTGALSGSWSLGTGAPLGTLRADGLAYMRTLAGRNDDIIFDGDAPAEVVRAATTARLCF